MSSSFNSPSRSPGSSRLQYAAVGGVSRLRSSSMKKPPEPLRKAVADCLSSPSSSSTSSSTSYHGGLFSNDASRTLRDYLAFPSTTDLAYNVILDHTIAERERSPAVVARCVALLKRYLLRYKPSEETLLLIDRFCLNTIYENDIIPNWKLSPLSQPLNQQYGASTVSSNIASLPVSTFASAALVKSLNYVRSLVAKHIPKRSFQPAAFAGAPSASGQSLPSLSSLLRKSFNSQLSPAVVPESLEKDAVTSSIPKLSSIESINEKEDIQFIPHDVLNWRWLGEPSSSSVQGESDHGANPHDMRAQNFLEVGAAALLVGDMEAKIRGQPWKVFGTDDMPYLDQLLQPSPVAPITNSASARPHLRAITASKRSRSGARQIWEDSPVNTFRPRARPLFQYRHYSEQQPLRLNPAEVCEVIAAVCSETSLPNANAMTVSSKLSINRGKPSMDVAVSVLIKLVIDMYVSDSQTAAPLTLSMLEEMLSSPRPACRVRAFDLILNLGVHGHLLERIVREDAPVFEEELSPKSFLNSESQITTPGRIKGNSSVKSDVPSALDNFVSWILNILYEILLFLVQIEEKEESVWSSALSCLLYFVCDRGKIWRHRLKGLDIRVIKALLETSRTNSWAELVHCKLISMLTNMFYEVQEENIESDSIPMKFLADQIDLIGLEFIFLEYSLANSREERRNLYTLLFDYILHQLNETCLATGENEYSQDEIQPLAALLAQADAPEAFYISVKLGVEGIGEILRRSISSALSGYANKERLNMLLELVAEKFDTLISSFTHLNKEFSSMIQITKSFKFLDSVEAAAPRIGVGMKRKISWATLHSLLHSERVAYRWNGYIWLGDLLIADISGKNNGSVWSNIKQLQESITQAGKNDSSKDGPLAISLMCGLLKSKHNFIRWGFLFVLERLLMRCKFLLDESDDQPSSSNEIWHMEKDKRLEKANAVVDLMSSALLLVYQINETDRINILKMCDILFSQLCLRVPPVTAVSVRDEVDHSRFLNNLTKIKINDIDEGSPSQCHEFKDTGKKCCFTGNNHLDYETSSMAALLLRGQAIVPMQLVARVPAALFYWPLIQLAGAATDNIALGVAVGSKGRGNLPGATSDIRATLLLLLIGKCTADPASFQEVGLEQFFRELLDDTDSRVAYYSSAFLLKAVQSFERMMTGKPDKYQNLLQNLVVRAQQSNNEKLLENPYLQMRGILQLANDIGTDL